MTLSILALDTECHYLVTFIIIVANRHFTQSVVMLSVIVLNAMAPYIFNNLLLTSKRWYSPTVTRSAESGSKTRCQGYKTFFFVTDDKAQ